MRSVKWISRGEIKLCPIFSCSIGVPIGSFLGGEEGRERKGMSHVREIGELKSSKRVLDSEKREEQAGEIRGLRSLAAHARPFSARTAAWPLSSCSWCNNHYYCDDTTCPISVMFVHLSHVTYALALRLFSTLQPAVSSISS